MQIRRSSSVSVIRSKRVGSSGSKGSSKKSRRTRYEINNSCTCAIATFGNFWRLGTDTSSGSGKSKGSMQKHLPKYFKSLFRGRMGTDPVTPRGRSRMTCSPDLTSRQSDSTTPDRNKSKVARQSSSPTGTSLVMAHVGKVIKRCAFRRIEQWRKQQWQLWISRCSGGIHTTVAKLSADKTWSYAPSKVECTGFPRRQCSQSQLQHRSAIATARSGMQLSAKVSASIFT